MGFKLWLSEIWKPKGSTFKAGLYMYDKEWKMLAAFNHIPHVETGELQKRPLAASYFFSLRTLYEAK